MSEFLPCPNGECEHNDLMHDGFPGERPSCYVESCPCGKAELLTEIELDAA